VSISLLAGNDIFIPRANTINLDSILFNFITCYSVSSLAWFMSNQETSFVTIGQRVLARPLK
jgi:hypothetical protein